MKPMQYMQRCGYRFREEDGDIVYEYEGEGDPPRGEETKKHLRAIQERKQEALRYLRQNKDSKEHTPGGVLTPEPGEGETPPGSSGASSGIPDPEDCPPDPKAASGGSLWGAVGADLERAKDGLWNRLLERARQVNGELAGALKGMRLRGLRLEPNPSGDGWTLVADAYADDWSEDRQKYLTDHTEELTFLLRGLDRQAGSDPTGKPDAPPWHLLQSRLLDGARILLVRDEGAGPEALEKALADAPQAEATYTSSEIDLLHEADLDPGDLRRVHCVKKQVGGGVRQIVDDLEDQRLEGEARR